MSRVDRSSVTAPRIDRYVSVSPSVTLTTRLCTLLIRGWSVRVRSEGVSAASVLERWSS